MLLLQGMYFWWRLPQPEWMMQWLLDQLCSDCRSHALLQGHSGQCCEGASLSNKGQWTGGDGGQVKTSTVKVSTSLFCLFTFKVYNPNLTISDFVIVSDIPKIEAEYQQENQNSSLPWQKPESKTEELFWSHVVNIQPNMMLMLAFCFFICFCY